MPIGSNGPLTFRQLRRQQGYDSDKQVAELAGMSRAHLSLALAGKSQLSEAMVAALARALNVSTEVVVLSIRSELAAHRQRQLDKYEAGA